MRRNQKLGMPPLRAGLLTIFLALVVAYFGFTKAIPLRHHFEIQAVVKNSTLLRPHSPVRIAGVNIGQVVKTERYKNTDDALVTMRIDDNGQPLHRDATLKIRPRLFLEGNFYVDLQPGTPAAGTLSDGGLIPITQTATPVQLDQVLTALQSDTRGSLQRALKGIGTAFNGEPSAADDAAQDPDVRGLTGAQALNKTLTTSPQALRDTGRVAGAFLGTRPHELSKTLAGLTKAMTALSENDAALGDFLTDYNATVQTTAAHSADLTASVHELGPTARNAAEAFTKLNEALPGTRRFSRELAASLPELPATIAAAEPWLAQAKRLLGDDELGGLLDRLSPATSDLAALGHATRTWLPHIDEFNRCITNVILPTGNIKVNDGDLSANTENYKEFWRAMVGLAGEGQGFDGNGNYLRLQAAGGGTTIRTGKTNYSQFSYIGRPTLPPLRTRPAYGNQLPPTTRSVPCSQSPVPNVNDKSSTGPADGSNPDGAAPSADAVLSGGGG
jgi:phospholipid/cholesterol/gamma-HCH transport system substrate-binding protein